MAEKFKELSSRGMATGNTAYSSMQFERHNSAPTQQPSSASLTTQQALYGGVDQFSALIVPPEFAVNGNEKGDTSTFISEGQRQVYQAAKPAARGGAGSNIQPTYGTFTEGEPPHRHQQAALGKSLPVPSSSSDALVPGKDQLHRSLKVSYVPIKVDSARVPHKALSSFAHVSLPFPPDIVTCIVDQSHSICFLPDLAVSEQAVTHDAPAGL